MKKISFTKLVALFWLQLQHTRYKMLYNIRMKNKNLHFIEQRSTLLHADMLSNAKDQAFSVLNLFYVYIPIVFWLKYTECKQQRSVLFLFFTSYSFSAPSFFNYLELRSNYEIVSFGKISPWRFLVCVSCCLCYTHISGNTRPNDPYVF